MSDDRVDELALQRLKSHIDGAADLRSVVEDAVEAWLTYQDAREQIGEFVRSSMNKAAEVSKNSVAGGSDSNSFIGALFASGTEFMKSDRFVNAMVDEILDPAIAAGEDNIVTTAEEREGVCRHVLACREDGAPDDAIIVPCAIVELFHVETGQAVQDIRCPACRGVLIFRIWRPKQTRWAVEGRPELPAELPGDDIGPWLECSECGGWSTLAYKRVPAVPAVPA